MLIEIGKGLFYNPAHIQHVDEGFGMDCVFMYMGWKDDPIMPSRKDWEKVKHLLVMPAPAPADPIRYGIVAPNPISSETARAVTELIEDEDASIPHTDDTPVMPMPAIEEEFDFEDDENAGGPLPETDLSRLQILMLEGDYVFLDTETTGLNGDAEICQIAIVDAKGKTLLDTLVKPCRPIPADAARIHGITNEAVENAPSWAAVRPLVIEAMRGMSVIVYNAVYDLKMLHQSDGAAGLSRVDYKAESAWHCAMLAYAEYRGEWNEYHGNYRWHKLTVAAENIRYVLPKGMAPHTALADCLMSRALCRKMAGITL